MALNGTMMSEHGKKWLWANLRSYFDIHMDGWMEESHRIPISHSEGRDWTQGLEYEVGISYLVRCLFYRSLVLLYVCGLLFCTLYGFHLQGRIWQRDFRDRPALQPEVTYYPDLCPPSSYIDNALNSVTTHFVKAAINKMRSPIFCMAWTPEGRRLVTGASSGELTLWNGLTFNFETIMQVI
jgi:WD40 repeat protein